MWQPIETAPKDGTSIDVYCLPVDSSSSNCGYRIIDVQWIDDCGGTGWVEFDIGIMSYSLIEIDNPDFYVSHWMPSPNPPKRNQ